MTTVQQFNDMMTQFFSELVATFPEEKQLKKYQMTYELLKKTNGRKCVDMYMESAKAFHTQIMSKDDSFFLTGEVEFLDAMNIKKWWTADLSENTKGAIWQYLQSLNVLGMTIVAIPEDAMKTIEQVAKQVEQNMQSGGGGGNPLGGAGLGDLAAIAGQIDMNALSSVFESLGLGNMKK